MSYSNCYGYYTNNDTESLLTAAERSYKFTSAANASALNSPYPVKLGSNEKGDLYIRSFLINSRPNSRGWSVAPETIRKNVLSAIGKPIVLDKHPVTGRIDHPIYYSSRSASDNLEQHRKKAIGFVESVHYDSETDSYYADSKITDETAKSYFNFTEQGSRVPIAVSPQILYNPKREKPNYYKDWSVSHLAIVENGAYGKAAKVIGTCLGDKTTCSQKLQLAAASASAEAAASASVATNVDRYVSLASKLPKVPNRGKRRGTLA